jgi:hypothetical protein
MFLDELDGGPQLGVVVEGIHVFLDQAVREAWVDGVEQVGELLAAAVPLRGFQGLV